MATNTNMKVLIVGGGPCGLAIAQGLKLAGINYTVFETHSPEKARSRDWAMALHWGYDCLKECLPTSLLERLRESHADPNYSNVDEGYPFHNGSTGELLRVVPSQSPRRIARSKLRNLLSEGVEVQYGKKYSHATTMEDTVTVYFEDGTQETGTILIGTDGGRSKVREVLVGEEAAKTKKTGLTMINLPYSYNARDAVLLRSLHPIFKGCYLPDTTFMSVISLLDAADPDKPETWKFQIWQSWQGPPYASDLADPQVRMKFWKEHSSKLAEPWRTAGLAVKDDVVLPMDPFAMWSPMPWDNRGGKITLAGDAAHSMPPFRGQGLNNAFQDSANVLAAIKSVVSGQKTQKEAIDAYEAEMIPRALTEIELSLEQAYLAHDWKTLTQSPYWREGVGMHRPQPEATVANIGELEAGRKVYANGVNGESQAVKT